MTNPTNSDTAFAGSIPQVYEKYLVPLIFEPYAADLARRVSLRQPSRVLEIAAGTGVVTRQLANALPPTASIVASDLNQQMLDHAAAVGTIHPVEWRHADAMQLPFPDEAFDVVVCQFGHMFAPRPDVAMAEMRRVLKPDGRIAFATWPPEHLVGRMFAFVGRNSPPPPAGASPPQQWGDSGLVTERLGARFDAPFFERGTMAFPALSLAHFRGFMERSVGPIQKLVESLVREPEKLGALRAGFDALVAPYYFDNLVRQDYLLTRAQAR